MDQKIPSILHHKYSLDDGHVTPQISNVDSYGGIMLVKDIEPHSNSPFTSFLTLAELKKNPERIKNLNIVGAHIHHGSLAFRYELLKKKYGLPLFVGFRGKDATAFPKKKENLRKLHELFQTADLFFPVCKHLRKKIIALGCPKRKIRVLYGGVDLERFELRPRQLAQNQKVHFLSIGRFVEKKGFSELIRAFAIVKVKHPQSKLLLIGSGPCEKEYRRLIKQYSLGRSVKLVPWVDYRNIQEQYYNAHIFCAPSLTDREGNQEGIPNTLKEAMATGMPVVSTYHAGIPELVKHKASGLLVPEKSVKELAKAMLWLAEHPEKWSKFGRKARERVEQDFNLTTQLLKQKKYYDEVIKNENSRWLKP